MENHATHAVTQHATLAIRKWTCKHADLLYPANFAA